MQDKLNGRERSGWLFAALSVLCALRLSELSWLYVLLGAAAAAVYFSLLGFLRGKESRTLSELAVAGFGKRAGSVLLLLCTGWTVLVLASVLSSAASAFPEDDIAILAPVTAAAMAAIGCRKGLRACAGAAGVLAMILALLYGVVALASLKQIEPEWCGIWGSWRHGLEAFAFLLLPSCLFFLPGKDEQQKRSNFAAQVLLPAVPAFLCAAVLSPQLTKAQRLPFYLLTKSLSLFGAMERFEPLLSGAMFMGFVCLAMLLAQTAGKICGFLAGSEKKNAFGIGAAAAGLALSFVVGRLPTEFWIFGSSIFWGLFPALTQFVGGSKNLSEKVKKEVDKTDFL